MATTRTVHSAGHTGGIGGANKPGARAASDRSPDLSIAPQSTSEGNLVTGPQPSADDIVQDILAAVAKASPALSIAALAAVEADIRKVWGGSNVWIGRHRSEARHERAEAIRKGYACSLSVTALCRLHGVSKSTVYRAIGVAEPP